MSLVRMMWRLARFRPWLFLAATIASQPVADGVLLIPGLVMQRFFDSLSLPARSAPAAWWFGAVLVGAGVTQVVAGIWIEYFEALMVRSSRLVMRRNLLAAILSRPGAAPFEMSTGDALSRVRDDVGRLGGALSWNIYPLTQLAIAAVAVYVLAWVDAFLTAVLVVPVLLSLATVHAFSPQVRSLRLAAEKAGARVAEFITETFTGLDAVRGAAAEERFAARFESLGKTRRQAEIRDAICGGFLGSASSWLASLGAGVLLLLVAAPLRDGHFTIGSLVLFTSYIGVLAQLSRGTSGYLFTFRQAAVSLRRCEELMAPEPVDCLTERTRLPLDPEAPAPRLALVRKKEEKLRSLEVRHLTYRHRRGGGVRDISFRLEGGSRVVIAGRIRSGKTTLLRVLLGLLPLQHGEVLWNGTVPQRLDKWMTPPRCAYVAQIPRLLSTTIADNVSLGSVGDIRAALNNAVLDEDVARFGEGVETVVGPRGLRLSGGQRLRLATARAFFHQPDLIVLDDVSSALDNPTESVLWRRLGVERGLTALIVSNREQVIAAADEVLLLQEGAIAARGRPQALMTESRELNELLRAPEAWAN